MTSVVDLRRPTRRVVALGRCLTSSELRALQQHLGESFVVVDDEWLEGDDVIVSPTMSEPVVGLLKSRHPGCLVLCVVRQAADAASASADVVTALEHGADGCVVHPTMAELAAHVKALVRMSVPHSRSRA